MPYTNTGGTPLMVAASSGDSGLLTELLKRGTRPEAKSSSGFTALAIARQQAHQRLARLLRQAGAKE